MWWQFVGQNIHFVIYLFAALISLGVGWLYLDAWSNKHSLKELVRWVGFLALGVSFFLQATTIEQTVLGGSFLGHFGALLLVSFRLLGYGLIALGQFLEPLQAVPDDKGLTRKSRGLVAIGSLSSKTLMPLGALLVAALYWRRATVGLERHLRPVAYGFVCLAVADLVGLAALLRTTTNPMLYSWVAAFGPLWWFSVAAVGGAVVVLGRWTWGYLTERFFSQLFMLFTTMVVAVFMVVSVGFTGLLLRSVQSDALANLHTQAGVLQYAIKSKQAETMAFAEQLAADEAVLNAVTQKDHAALRALTDGFMAKKGISSLIITNQSGQVLLRGEDGESWGDSVSNDIGIKRALIGLPQSTVVVNQDALGAALVQIRSVATIQDGSGAVQGSVASVVDLNSAFVDGIRADTGLESSVYAGKTLAATSLTTANGKTRPVGTKSTNPLVNRSVLEQGNAYQGSVRLQNRQLLASFVPLKDVDNGVVGMLLVARPESTVLFTAGRSIQITFLAAVLLLMLSFVPTYFVTRSLVRQLA